MARHAVTEFPVIAMSPSDVALTGISTRTRAGKNGDWRKERHVAERRGVDRYLNEDESRKNGD